MYVYIYMAFLTAKARHLLGESERESDAILARAFAQQYPLNHNRI